MFEFISILLSLLFFSLARCNSFALPAALIFHPTFETKNAGNNIIFESLNVNIIKDILKFNTSNVPNFLGAGIDSQNTLVGCKGSIVIIHYLSNEIWSVIN